MQADSMRWPALFLGHGSPMYAIEPNRYTQAWATIGARLGRPRAVLAISAHWYVGALAVTAMQHPRTIHDFGGFPRALHEVEYPAPGDPALARRVQALLAPEPVVLDEDAEQGWGLDHGAWSVLRYLLPAADVPVVQLSLDGTRPPQWHYDLARRLAPLREEGVLIVGSGNIVHNLRRANWADGAPPYDWALRHASRVRGQVLGRDHQPLIDYVSGGQDAQLSIPTPEHYLPLLYVLAQQRPDEPVTMPIEGIELGSIDMAAVLIGR